MLTKYIMFPANRYEPVFPSLKTTSVWNKLINYSTDKIQDGVEYTMLDCQHWHPKDHQRNVH